MSATSSRVSLVKSAIGSLGVDSIEKVADALELLVEVALEAGEGSTALGTEPVAFVVRDRVMRAARVLTGEWLLLLGVGLTAAHGVNSWL